MLLWDCMALPQSSKSLLRNITKCCYLMGYRRQCECPRELGTSKYQRRSSGSVQSELPHLPDTGVDLGRAGILAGTIFLFQTLQGIELYTQKIENQN